MTLERAADVLQSHHGLPLGPASLLLLLLLHRTVDP